MRTILLCAALMTLSLSLSAQDHTESYNYRRGVEAYGEEEYGDALEYFDKEIREHPKNGYAYFYISYIHYLYDERGEALTTVNKALQYLPQEDNTWISAAFTTRAAVYLELEDTAKALSDYSMAIKYDPEDIDLLFKRAQIYYEVGEYSLSNADYRKIIKIQPGNPYAYIGLGRYWESRGQYEAAISQYSQALKLDADNKQAYEFRAETYWKMRKYEEGANDIVKALEIESAEDDDSDDSAWYTLGQAPKESYPAIIEKLRVQAILHPEDAATWNTCTGIMYASNEEYEKANTYYIKAFDMEPHGALASLISFCYQQQGEYGTAMEYIDKAIEMSPEDYSYLYRKAGIEYSAGRMDDALNDITEYINVSPDYEGYYERGWYHAANGDTNEAIADLNTSIAIEQSVPAIMLRGRQYLRKGQEEKAVADFQQVLLLDTTPELGSNAQFALFFLGDDEGAKEWMDAVLEADNSARTYYDAACLYSLMGDTDQALAHLSTALEKGYKGFYHMSKDTDLDNIRNLHRFKSLVRKYEAQTQTATHPASPQEQGNYVEKVEEVPFTMSGTTYKVKCRINDLPLHFIFDTGASDVSLSNVEASFMLKNGYIKPSDVIGRAGYMTASGEIVEGTVINLREVSLGNLSLKDVRASVTHNQKAPLLLGQSVLSRLGKIEIDNRRRVLKITYKVRG